MVLRKVAIALFVALPLWADTGYNPPAVIVSTDDAHAVSQGIQKLILSTGTALSISGGIAKISLGAGSTNYVQTNPTSQQTTAFNTSSGTTGNFNTNQIQFQVLGNLIKYKDGTIIFSSPGVQETFLGYNTNLVNNGGVFNTSYGATAMPYPNTGNFNNAFGNSSMSGNLLSGENNNGMGYASLASLSSGFYNNAMGGSACQSVTTPTGNTCVGAYALNRNVNSDVNSAIGYRSLFWTTGAGNIGIGYEAGTSSDSANANVTGDHNMYFGVESGQDLVSASALTNSAAMGFRAYVHKSNQFQMGGQQGSGKEWTVLTSTLSVANHYNNAGRISPVVSSCGLTPSITGYDSAGTITVGSGVTTSCTLTFASAWTNTPTCVIADNSTAVTGDISSISATAVTFGFSASIGSGKIYYICVGADS